MNVMKPWTCFLLVIFLLCVPAVSPVLAAPTSRVQVDLNTASQKDLEALPGIGAATAKKIIAGRPYASVNDLSRAGVSASTISKISGQVVASGSAPPPPVAAAPRSSRAAAPRAAPQATGAPLDLNSASEKDLVRLPGIGEVTARKIVAGRPYSGINDLSRAGVSASTIQKIGGLVTVSNRSAMTPPVMPPSRAPQSSAAPQATGASVDLNRASMKDLEVLPQVGSVTAMKIIGHRPYQSVDDLQRAGLSARTINAIRGMVTVGNVPMSPAPSPSVARSVPVPTPMPQPTTVAPVPASEPEPPTATVVPRPQGGAGMVWVNTETKVYHHEGDRWYGRTKHGKYMSESEAMTAGFRASKSKEKVK